MPRRSPAAAAIFYHINLSRRALREIGRVYPSARRPAPLQTTKVIPCTEPHRYELLYNYAADLSTKYGSHKIFCGRRLKRRPPLPFYAKGLQPFLRAMSTAAAAAAAANTAETAMPMPSAAPAVSPPSGAAESSPSLPPPAGGTADSGSST